MFDPSENFNGGSSTIIKNECFAICDSMIVDFSPLADYCYKFLYIRYPYIECAILIHNSALFLCSATATHMNHRAFFK
jgi:hypothetical protein